MAWLVAMILTIMTNGCSSVKRVLKDPEKFNKVAEEVFRRGLAVNDTVTNTVLKDTTIFSTVVTHDTTTSPCPDFEKTLDSGVKVKSIAGVLTVEVPMKQADRILTREVVHNIRDKTYENILLADKNKVIDKMMVISTERDSLSKKLDSTKVELKAAKRAKTLIFIGIGLAGLVLAYFRLKKLLPF